MDPTQPKTVYIARSKTEAAIVQGWLEQEQIESRVFDGSDTAGIFDIVDSNPQIIVEEKDYEQARQVIEGYQKELQETPDMANVSDAEGQFDWPTCPVCDELQLATCDQCNVTSSEFSIDEPDAGSNDEKVICLACNNQTSITFAENCKFCEHDFTGNTPDSVSLVDADAMQGQNNNRVLLLVAGLIVLIIILAIGFSMATS